MRTRTRSLQLLLLSNLPILPLPKLPNSNPAVLHTPTPTPTPTPTTNKVGNPRSTSSYPSRAHRDRHSIIIKLGILSKSIEIASTVAMSSAAALTLMLTQLKLGFTQVFTFLLFILNFWVFWGYLNKWVIQSFGLFFFGFTKLYLLPLKFGVIFILRLYVLKFSFWPIMFHYIFVLVRHSYLTIS